MPTLREGIYNLLSAVRIDTKEEGRTHVEPWPSQRMIIDMVCDGLENDVHEFVILKSRQVAATTVCSVIELFWALANPGTQGAIIADRTDNLERLRRIFASLLETLPREWRGQDHQIIQNNRNGLAFANRSVIDLLAAASNPDLGASRALNMCHMTECGQWKSAGGVESLKASLARQNPNRLYMWESIANGLNWWEKMWRRAKVDPHMRACFLGFWSNPVYSIPRDDADFQTYMGSDERGRFAFTADEIKRSQYVFQNYRVTVRPEQIAWWRRESQFTAEEAMLRHYPWTETEAFISSGSAFFPARRTLEIAQQLGDGMPYQGYKYLFEEDFLESRIEQTTNPDDAQLKVWEPPDPKGIYAIGIDPSGGGGGEADDHCIEVFRCYADRFVQVAEFCTNKPFSYQLAWVLCHLCGAYRDFGVTPPVANLEVTGIGYAVMSEVRNLRLLAERGFLQPASSDDRILEMIGTVRWFLWKRPDTMSGMGNVTNFKTNADNKEMIFSEFRDSVREKEPRNIVLDVRSSMLLEEMQAIVDDDGYLAAGPDTGMGDNRVMAACLAHHAWAREGGIRGSLLARGMTWRSVHEEAPPKGPAAVLKMAYMRQMDRMNQKESYKSRAGTF